MNLHDSRLLGEVTLEGLLDLLQLRVRHGQRHSLHMQAATLKRSTETYTALLTEGEHTASEAGIRIAGMRRSGLSEPYCCRHAV